MFSNLLARVGIKAKPIAPPPRVPPRPLLLPAIVAAREREHATAVHTQSTPRVRNAGAFLDPNVPPSASLYPTPRLAPISILATPKSNRTPIYPLVPTQYAVEVVAPVERPTRVVSYFSDSTTEDVASPSPANRLRKHLVTVFLRQRGSLKNKKNSALACECHIASKFPKATANTQGQVRPLAQSSFGFQDNGGLLAPHLVNMGLSLSSITPTLSFGSETSLESGRDLESLGSASVTGRYSWSSDGVSFISARPLDHLGRGARRTIQVYKESPTPGTDTKKSRHAELVESLSKPCSSVEWIAAVRDSARVRQGDGKKPKASHVVRGKGLLHGMPGIWQTLDDSFNPSLTPIAYPFFPVQAELCEPKYPIEADDFDLEIGVAL